MKPGWRCCTKHVADFFPVINIGCTKTEIEKHNNQLKCNFNAMRVDNLAEKKSELAIVI